MHDVKWEMFWDLLQNKFHLKFIAKVFPHAIKAARRRAVVISLEKLHPDNRRYGASQAYIIVCIAAIFDCTFER